MTFRFGVGEAKLGSAEQMRCWGVECGVSREQLQSKLFPGGGGWKGEEWRQLGREAKEDAGCDRSLILAAHLTHLGRENFS